jgi:tRNA (guanine37-N1)-methyltransferase
VSEPATEPWSIDVLTLFPHWLQWLEEVRPIRNATDAGLLDVRALDMREHSPLKHRQVDDTPYGGGAGMVLRVDVLVAAMEGHYQRSLDETRAARRIVLLTPAGRIFDDALATQWAEERRPTTILCGRYEGFDHRVHEHVATEEISIGPYVLSGGEVAAMTMIDAAARKLPGALGNEESLADETFSEALGGGAEYPHYTRPAEFRGWEVPEILSSGHHAEIQKWRLAQSEARTRRQAGQVSAPLPDVAPDRWKRWWNTQGRAELQVLLRVCWDPIGVYGWGSGATQDEYDAYADRVARVLRSGATAVEIDSTLAGLAADRMGLGGSGTPAPRTIAEWYRKAMFALARDPETYTGA